MCPEKCITRLLICTFTQWPFLEICDHSQITILGTYYGYCILSPQISLIVLKGQYDCVLHLYMIKYNLKKKPKLFVQDHLAREWQG